MGFEQNFNTDKTILCFECGLFTSPYSHIRVVQQLKDYNSYDSLTNVSVLD